MALEDLTGADKFIANLNPANPVGSDDKRDGDNHIRGIKNVLRNTFPNINGAVTLTDEDLSTPKVNRGGDTMTGPLTVNAMIKTFTPTGIPAIVDLSQVSVASWGIKVPASENRLSIVDNQVGERLAIDADGTVTITGNLKQNFIGPGVTLDINQRYPANILIVFGGVRVVNIPTTGLSGGEQFMFAGNSYGSVLNLTFPGSLLVHKNNVAQSSPIVMTGITAGVLLCVQPTLFVWHPMT